MRSIKLACLFVALISATAWAKNPVPLVNQLVPPSAKPGSGGFTLVVIGSDFSHSSSVYWNGTSRVTEFVSRSRLNALINAADVAKAGTASVTVVNSGKRIPASNVVYFPVRGRSASVVLTADPQLTTQGALVVGDFNNDGKLDVAVAQQSGNSTGILNVFLGKGNGDFEVPVQMNFDVWPERIVSGDFNGDGNLDLIVTGFDQQQGGDVGLVFLGKGNGRFVLQKEIGPAFAAAVADFDGDGNLDLIAYQYSTGESVVFFGNGDGTFTSGSSFDDGVAPAVGDFNGDGKLDLAFSNDGIKSYGLDVWLGNGDGTFVYSDTYVNNCGGGTAAAAAVDMNNDGILDVVSSSGCVWLGNGDGTFTPNGGFTVGGTVYYVTVGDFNGDGKLDIGTTDVYNFAVLLGNGDGTIQKAIEFPADGIQTIGMGDFNGDGRLDLIGDSSTQTYLLLQDSVLLTPRQLDFGQRKVGTASQPQTAALKNDDSSPLEIQNISITGSDPKDFLQTNDCPAKLAPGATCKIKVRFRPTTQGTRSAALSVSYIGAGSPQMVSLTGTGIVATVSLSPSRMKFHVQLVDKTSAAQTATLTNTGNEAVAISNISATPPFLEGNDCPSSLPAGGNCKIQVKFRPMTKGPSEGKLSVKDDAQGSPQTVPLLGTGTIVQLSASSINFGNQKVGTKSPAVPVQLTNLGSTNLSISQIAITGADPEDFAETNNCGNSVPAGGSCTIKIRFEPTATGQRSASLAVSDDGGGSPQMVALTGTGT